MEVIRVRNTKASDLAKLIDQIINKGKNQIRGTPLLQGSEIHPSWQHSQGSGNEASSLVITDEHTFSSYRRNTQGIDKIRKLVAKLDVKIRPEDAGGVYVYYVRFGDAEKIATTLTGLATASTQTNQQAAQPGMAYL